MKKLKILFLIISVLSVCYLHARGDSLFPHIKTYASIYGYTDSEQAEFCRTHFDIGTGIQKITEPSLVYINWTDLDQSNVYYALLYQYCTERDVDFDDMFFHYKKDVAIPEQSSWAPRDNELKENRFFQVLLSNMEWGSESDAHSGNSLIFNGIDTYVEIDKSFNEKIEDEVTFEVWIKPKQQNLKSIVGWDTQNSLWIDSNGKIVMEIEVNGQRRGSPRYPIPEFDVWYHLVGVGDATQGVTRLYVDGKEIDSGMIFAPGHITGRTSSLNFGRVSNYYYKGTMDDVRIYNRALTSAEIKQRFESNAHISLGLVGHWAMDEGSGEKLIDSSISNISGYIPLNNKTEEAFGDKKSESAPFTYTVLFCQKSGTAMYIGHPWRFREVNINLSQGADATWDGIWEFWDGTTWNTLVINDGTNDMQTSGKININVPVDWKKYISNDYSLYWVRLRCINSGITSPIGQTNVEIHGQYEWKGISAVSMQRFKREEKNIIVPGWNPDNDINKDGYVDDTEFANLIDPQATARFKYRSIAPIAYLTNRWVMNYAQPVFKEFAINESLKLVDQTGMAGVFLDNCNGISRDYYGGDKARVSFNEYDDINVEYRPFKVMFLTELNDALKKKEKLFIANGVFDYPDYAAEMDGFMIENCIYFNRSRYQDEPGMLERFYDKIKKYSSDNKKIIIHVDSDPTFYEYRGITKQRNQMCGLARYYLTATDHTYLKYQSSSDYSRPWYDWFDGIEYDIGKPEGEYYLYKVALRNYPDTPLANILINNGFEDNIDADASLPDDWKMYSNSGNVTGSMSDVSKTGIHSLCLIASDGISSGGAYQKVPMKTNTTYTLSAWVKTENLSGLNDNPIRLFAFCGPGGYSGTLSASMRSGTHDWTFISTVFTTKDDTTGSYIYAGRFYDAQGKVYIDDVRLEEGGYIQDYIYGRNFTNALVLYKPISNGDAAEDYSEATGIPIDLDESYYMLNPDGSLGEEVTSVTIKSYEGIILIKKSKLPDPDPNIDPDPESELEPELDALPLEKSMICYNNIINPLLNQYSTIKYELDIDSLVSLVVYDHKGKIVKVLVDEDKQAGVCFTEWDGRDTQGNVVGSGVYLVYIKADEYSKVKKIVVIK